MTRIGLTLLTLAFCHATGVAAVKTETITYKVGDTTGFLNGRRLTDDVIDTLLAVGANTPGASDCIGNDSTFTGSFPFEGAPN